MKIKGVIVCLAVALSLALAGGALAQKKGFLWDGHQWPQLSFDAKVGYIKGIGNLADFESAASKGKAPCISWAFAGELKTKSINQVIGEVDKFYRDNPSKLDTSVLEVILLRCTKVCPPGQGEARK
jgi:hypothetical protein